MSVIPFPKLYYFSLQQGDLAAAAAWLHLNWHETYGHVLPEANVEQHTVEHFTRYLGKKIGQAWIAKVGDQIAGLSVASMNCVDELWVDQKFQRRGIGGHLLQLAMTHFASKNYSAAQVGFESDNVAALEFFNAKGWRKIGSEPIRLAPGKSVEALVYSTSVTQQSA